jgi:Mn-containing catalase
MRPELMYTVRVDEPDPKFGNMLLEQFGGANGELAAAMQYSIQGLNCDDPGRKDLLMDIGTEELSHLEIVGTLARMHLKPLKSVREEAEVDPLVDEVMSEAKEKEDAPADLALIGAAQRVEHYEIAAYTTARNLALQLRQPAIVQLLTMSLGEEQNAGQLLDQVAQPLMSVARMPASVE